MKAPLNIVFVSACELSRRICAMPDDNCLRTTVEAEVGAAIAQCRATPPDMVLFDADGDEAAGAISALALAQTAPVIAMSARAWPGSEHAKRLIAAGAHALLPKPLGSLPLFMALPTERIRLADWLHQLRPMADAMGEGDAA